MKILLIGDIHFRAKRHKDISHAWEELMQFAHSNGVDLIAQAGDVFDHANVYGKEETVGTILNSFIDPFSQLDGLKLQMFGIPGNHDILGPNDLDALTLVDKYPWIQIKRIPDVYDVLPGLSICALPWVNRVNLISKLWSKGISKDEAKGKVEKAFAEMFSKLGRKVAEHQKKGNFVLFIGHLEITGAKLNGGEVQANGMFEFSPKDLASLGADAYGLAHIHMRQNIPGLPNPNDGYLGTLCQLSFGEQGNQTGARLLEIQEGKIVVDKWINNNLSPKYYTVEDLSNLQYRKGIDYVKIKGDIRPEALPDGIIFEKKKKVRDEREEKVNALNCDSTMMDLLKAWKEASKCEIPLDNLVSTAEELKAKISFPPDSIGSLDRIDRIHLKNITCHLNTQIDLSWVNGVCGIEGSNGSGKTTAIESILIALYGMSPSRTLQNLISLGATESSEVELSFVSRSKSIIARREFNRTPKTFSHKAYMLEGEGDKKPIAGPGADSVTNASLQAVGDPDLVLAGVFSSQSETGNIIDLKPAPRKELFAKLLGSDKFLLLSDLAKKLVTGDNAEIDACLSRIERLKVELADEPSDLASMECIRKKISSFEASIAKTTADVDLLKEELLSIENENKQREAVIAERSDKQRRLLEIKKEGKSLKDAKEALLQASDLTVLEAELKEAKAASEELNKLKEQAVKLKEQKAELGIKISDLKTQAMAISEKRTSEYAKALKEINAKNAEFQTKHETAFYNLVADRDLAYQASATIKSEIASAQAVAVNFPDQAICKTCPLAKNSLEVSAKIPVLEEKLKEKQAILSRVDTAIAAMSAGKQPPNKIIPIEEYMVQEAQEAEKLIVQASELESKSATLELPQEMRARALEIKPKAELLKSIEEKIAKAQNASDDIQKMEGQLAALRSNYLALESSIAAITIPEERDTSTFKSTIKTLQGELTEYTDGLKEANKEYGRFEIKLEAHTTRKNEIKDMETRIGAKLDRCKILNALVAAFGRDGIAQLIVDTTIPRFQEIMIDLLSEFDGKWDINIYSQKINKDGSAKEQIEIMVDDGMGEREISTYSGGEKKLLRSIIRIAFATLQAERSGKGLKILVLDEATDAMDEENSSVFVKILSKLKAFNQIFVISHNDRVLSMLPNCIQFNRMPGQATTIGIRGNKHIAV